MVIDTKLLIATTTRVTCSARYPNGPDSRLGPAPMLQLLRDVFDVIHDPSLNRHESLSDLGIVRSVSINSRSLSVDE